MSMIKIDKDIPAPVGIGHTNVKYPWRDMEVGDSFLSDKKMASMAALAHTSSIKLGCKFKCKPEGEGVRVWRVE